MHELDIENSLRKKTYDWFKSFKNPTYGINVTMDVTKAVEELCRKCGFINRVR